MKKLTKQTRTIPFEENGSREQIKKLNEIEYLDTFEIIDIEEKLDFGTYEGGGCVNNDVAGCAC